MFQLVYEIIILSSGELLGMNPLDGFAYAKPTNAKLVIRGIDV